MMHLSIEELTFFRGRSSIDLEAIFGGHISGRRLRGVKINPIFHDPEHCYSAVSNTSISGETDDQCPEEDQIHVDVYESLPRPARISRLKRQTQSEPELLDLDSSSPEWSPYTLRRQQFGVHSGIPEIMRDENQESEIEKSDSSSSLGKDEGVKEGAVSRVENKELDDKKGAASSEKNQKESDQKPESSNPHKGQTEVDTLEAESPSRRLSDSSMIVYEDVDQASFPMLSSVISHLSSYGGDASGPDVQENILLYTSDGESPTNDLMSVPCENSDSDWPNIADITMPSDSEEGSQCNEEDLPKVPCPSASSKPLRPILLSTTSNDDSNAFPKSANLSPSEQKTVTFAKDTVFNEDKPKRYQKEKINLKELYHERVCGRSGMGMVNPVFVISDEKLTLAENAGDCLTDDEKAKRHSFKINLVSARPSGMDSASVSSENSSPSQRMPDLNTPAYLQKYLDRARETTLDSSRETTVSSSSTAVASTSAATTELNEMNDINAACDIILELPEDSYGRRERKKAQRRKVLKWTLLFLTIVILVSVAMGLGIYFTNQSTDDSVEITTPTPQR